MAQMKNTMALGLLAVCTLVLSSITGAVAQETPPARIIVIDYQRVSNESLVGQDIAGQMESNRVDLEKRVQSLNDDLTGEEENLRAQRNIMSQEAFEERLRAFQQKQQGARAELNQLTQASRRAIQQANIEVQRSLRPIVKQIMDEKGATLVLDKNIVAQHASGLDVTTEVIERLDQAMPSFEVALPAVTN